MARIIPRFKLILTYNIQQNSYDEYYRFVVQDFTPGVQDLGLHMFRVYHTAYGEYPMRQVELLVEDMATIERAIASANWNRLESRLKGYVADYKRRVVPFREGFQVMQG